MSGPDNVVLEGAPSPNRAPGNENVILVASKDTSPDDDSEKEVQKTQRLGWWMQLWWLTKKNLWMMRQRWISSLLQVLFPLYMVLWIYIIILTFEDVRPPKPNEIEPLLDSLNYPQKTDLDLMAPYIIVAPKASGEVTRFIDACCPNNGNKVRTFATHDEMMTEYYDNPATVFAAIDFTNPSQSITVSMNKTIEEGVFLPAATGGPNTATIMDFTFDPLKGMLPGITAQRSGYLELLMSALESARPNSPIQDASVMFDPTFLPKKSICSGIGCVFKILFPIMIMAVYFLVFEVMGVSIGTEKESGFFLTLRYSGMYPGTYWFSFVTSRLISSILPALVFTGAIYVAKVIVHSDFSLILVGVYTICIHLLGLGVFVGAICTSAASFLGYGICMMMTIWGPFYLVQYYMIAEDFSYSSVVATFLVPGVSYGRFGWEMAELDAAAENGFGNGLQWNDMGDYTAACMYMNVVSGLIYALIGIWIDYVFPMDGVGKKKPALFFLSGSFWFPPPEKQNVKTGELVVDARGVVHTFQVPEGEKSKKMKTLRAVDGVDLQLHKGVIVALLGHNGAGKTTLIRTLTNQLVPEGGSISIGGLSVPEAQKYIGICPQFDIVNGDLTACEHLELLGALKGLSPEESEIQARELLEAVGLTSVGKNTPVEEYSGGMKRRLSVCVALIGKPSLVILDEPSTGIDPVNRRRLWELLQKRSKTCAMLLTTHSLEEADMIGEQIYIMSGGKMKAKGTSWELKQKYGIGYNLQAKTTDSAKIKEIVSRHVPAAKTLTEVGDEYSVSLPLTAVNTFPALFTEMKNSEVLESTSVSMTTLEEAFMEFGKEEEERNKKDGDGDKDQDEDEEEEENGNENKDKDQGNEKNGTNGEDRKPAQSDETQEMVLKARTGIVSFREQALTVLYVQLINSTRNQMGFPFIFVIPVLYSIICVVVAAALRGESVDTRSLAIDPANEALGYLEMPAAGLLSELNSCDYGATALNPKFSTLPELDAYIENHKIENKDMSQNTGIFLEGPNPSCQKPTLLFNATQEYEEVSQDVYRLFSGLTGREAIKNFPTVELEFLPKGPTAFNEDDKKSFLAGGLMVIMSFPFAFLSFAFGEAIVTQRLDGTKELMLTSGVSRFAYWAGNFAAHFLLVTMCIAAALLVLICGQMECIYDSNWFGMVLLLFTAAPSLILFGYNYDFIFYTPKACQEWGQEIVNNELMIPFFIITFATGVNFTGHGYFLLALLPGFAVLQGASILQGEGIGLTPYTFADLFDTDKNYIYMVFGNLASPFIYGGLIALGEFMRSRKSAPVNKNQNPPLKDDIEASVNVKHPLITKNIVKEFRSKGRNFKAVNGINLSIPKEGIRCLLGLNGAGKTTLLKMITGNIVPTAGDAFIEGHSISHSKAHALHNLGICCQENRMFQYLSPRQTLIAMLRLQGVPADVRAKYVEKVLKMMQLSKKADAIAHTLSGGNQRKLCLAIAIVGLCPVILLDEPTTGLDTNTRRKIWEVIENCKKTSAVVLTTHSMEEADALANSISIQVNGQIEAEGTSLELKTRYGSGYKLQVRSNSPHEVTSHVKKLWPSAQFVESASTRNIIVFDIPIKVLPPDEIGEFFRIIESEKEALGVTEYSLTQATLDHVFINFNALQADETSTNK